MIVDILLKIKLLYEKNFVKDPFSTCNNSDNSSVLGIRKQYAIFLFSMTSPYLVVCFSPILSLIYPPVGIPILNKIYLSDSARFLEVVSNVISFDLQPSLSIKPFTIYFAFSMGKFNQSKLSVFSLFESYNVEYLKCSCNDLFHEILVVLFSCEIEYSTNLFDR